MSSTQWREEKYRQVYRSITSGLEHRRGHDPAFSIEDASAMLRQLYVQDGNNQDGRGGPLDVQISATIDAYEHFLDEWKRSIHREDS